MESRIEIHETAFVTSTFRSTCESLSRDPFSRLWNNEKTDVWVASYLREVSTEEPYTHCIRNRYFLDTIEALVEKNQVEVLINFGCGFSMYPFLLPEQILHIEIDKADVVEHKRSKVQDWQNQGLLPERNIHYIGVDFNEAYQDELSKKIAALKSGKSSFILLEGVLFFLNKEVTEMLFNLFSTLQHRGDYVGSVSYKGAVARTPVFKRLLHFFTDKLLQGQALDYQTLEDDFYTSLPGYQLLDSQDYFTLSAKYAHQPLAAEKEEVLNETYYLLQKT